MKRRKLFKPESRTSMVMGNTSIKRLCWALSIFAMFALNSVLAQPLERGVQLSSGGKFLVDKGHLRTLGGLGKPNKLHPEIVIRDAKGEKTESVEAIFQPKFGWDNSFLILTESQLLRGSVEGPRFQQTLLSQGSSQKPVIWGDGYLVSAKGSTSLRYISADLEQELRLDGALQNLALLSDRLAVAQTEEGFFEIKFTSTEALTTVINKISNLGELHSAENVQMVHSGRAVAIWSPETPSLAVCSAIPKAETLMVKLEQFKETLAVTPLGRDKFLATSEGAFNVLVAFDESQKFPRPESLPLAQDKSLRGFAKNDKLLLLTETEGKPVSVTLTEQGISKEQALAKGKIHHLIRPTHLAKNAPILFVTTKTEEPKFDNDGRAVYDLEAKKTTQKIQHVKGLTIYTLGDDGLWQIKAEEPRSNPVGPIEVIGSTVVFATQTEPMHQEGVELDLPNRYPYPAVILRGLSLNSQEPWFLKLERGLSPAKSRLPESTWPKADEFGPISLTSEDNRVLAIDPSTGELKWSSEAIGMDESSPPAYVWGNQLGLVTTIGATRVLSTLDTDNGKTLSSAALTEFFIYAKWKHLLGVIIICLALGGFIYLAGKRELYVRKIAGLQALDEAVGRATEMGKPVLFVTGLADVDDIQTLASLSILSHVAKKTAEYDTPIIATTARSVTYSAAQEVVRDAYTIAGRPDSFMSESVRYITDDQFGYTAGVDGIMLREEPAANFYMGKFYAESLILAETGQAAGAIQMAGTAEPAQLPFFVAACDYTLIGEELFAASAYLSGEPLQVGSLRGQDVGKAIFMVLLLLCSLWVTLNPEEIKVSTEGFFNELMPILTPFGEKLL